MLRRLAALLAVTAVPWLALSANVAAQDPVGDARVELRAAPGPPNGVEVVVRWIGHGAPGIRYEVWRRTPWDLRLQETEKYADVPASAAKPDGTFEFVDPDPLGMPDRPCYMIGATTGDTPPNSFALPGCIPTLPSRMASLELTALPGPDRNSWYVTGAGFAPGAYVVLQELTCQTAPCDSAPLPVSTRIQTAIDGRFSMYTTLPAGTAAGTRTIVAYEEGWLESQFPLAPNVSVPASHPGAALGHPLSARTDIAEVDRVIAALQDVEAGPLQSMFVLRKLPASDGELVDALPTLTCGNGDSIAIGDPGLTVLSSTAADLRGEHIYAVFKIAPKEGQWLAFEGATHAIVIVGAGGRRASMIAVNASGIVGAGRPCGAPPTFYLRDVAAYVLAPLSAPASPDVGSGTTVSRERGAGILAVAGLALLVGGAGMWFVAGRGAR